MNNKSMRILIADDHELIRNGIRNLLAGLSKYEVCGEAVNGQEAVRLAKELRPDVIIMDMVMPLMNGLEATKHVIKDGCDARILIFTLHEAKSLAETARKAGARGFLPKSQVCHSLISALEQLHDGGTFFDGA